MTTTNTMIETRTHSSLSFYSRSKRSCFVFAIANALCWILAISNLEVSGATASATAASDHSMDIDEYGVIDLTSKNFGSKVGIGDGTVWLIEFYTPTCKHCVNFARTYESIAHTVHKAYPEEKIRVARVDCSVERALMTRFGIEAFPSFFLLSGWDVYEFKETRGITPLIQFARGGYKKKNVCITLKIHWQQLNSRHILI